MKKVFILSFIVLGISSLIGQVVVIRELMISFYGNEFFIGWILFAWLFWVGIGSLVLEKLFKKAKTILKSFIGCHILVALFLPLEIYLIRLSKNIIGGVPGEIPNLIPALLYAFLIIAPLCLILGFQFVIANRTWKSFSRKFKVSFLLGKSYFYETIGFIIGGLVFSYILIFVNEFRVVGILAWLNLIAAGFIIMLFKNRSVVLKTVVILLFIIFVGIFIGAKNINLETNELRFPNQELIESKNSIYGNIAVTKTNSQYNFYESGLLLGADKEEIFNEYLIHFPFLYHSNPKNVLLIGAGFNGALGEILKYQPNEIYYLELDPQFIETTKKYLSFELRQYLENKRTKIVNLDGRYFLKYTKENFDVIIVNLPDPSTALINRFYSQEFLKEVQSRLSSQGILAIHLSSSPNYLNPELENLQASLYKTIKEVFPYLIILPEDANFFIASQNDILNYNPQPLIQRLKERNIKNNFVTENYIDYRLTNDRVQTVLNSLKTNQGAKINQDQHPISYYYNFVYWISHFRSGLAKFLAFLSKIGFEWIVGLFILILIVFLFFKEKIKKQNIFPLTMAIAGFSLMTAEIIIIYAFQVFYGYLYYKIGLIITALMVGMAIGTWLGTKKISRARISSVIKIHILIILFSIFLFSIFYFLFSASPKPSLIIELIFLTLAALIGGIVGFEFPIVNKLYLEPKIRLRPSGFGGQTGTIYGADLLGSCFGASLISIFILPIFGIFQALIILIMANVLILITLFLSQQVK